MSPSHVVINAIHRSFGAEVGAEIVARIWWSQLNKCWHFTHAGMTYGVEPDGHIHT